jgi:dipeptidase D
LPDILEREPKLLWKHFNEIRKIPRCSKHEELVRKYVLDFAKEQSLVINTDSAGNVVLSKPASTGFENKPILVLQGHLDMVCEKNSDKEFDFNSDPIELLIEDDWLTADGTSLGADNGIGIATTLAILEDNSLEHGAIEGLFTIDEETGLTGAFQLNSDFLIGRTMLNLDSEEEGVIYVGCAGGGDTQIKLPIQTLPIPADHKCLIVKVIGLRGGHSGIDIQEQRGNAIKIMARLLAKALGKTELFIGEFTGGSKRNAIPREAFTKIALKPEDEATFRKSIESEAANILFEIKPIDPEFKVTFEETEQIAKVITKESQNNLLDLINGLPHGVLSMNFDIPDLVETSTNLAVINTKEDSIDIDMSTRSSINSALEAGRGSIRSIATLAGAKVTQNTPYPGWKPNMESDILKLTKAIQSEMYGKEPEIKAIHAGLECGIIGEKFQGMDMISIGPELKYPHSPEEKVHIGSVERFYNLVLKIMERIK